MRKRSRIEAVPNETVHCQFNAAQRSATVGTWQEKSIEDIETPDFSRLLKCGKFLPLNPTVITTRSETLRMREPVDIWRTSNPSLKFSGDPTAYYGGVWNGLTPSGAGTPQLPVGRWDWPEAIRDDALTDLVVQTARANVYADRWDVLTFLGELNSTIATFHGLARRFWAALKEVADDGARYAAEQRRARKAAARRRKSLRHRMKQAGRSSKRRVESASRYVQENWLLARYGIRPILYDIQDIVHLVSELQKKREAGLVVGKARQNSQRRDVAFATYGNPMSGAATTTVSWSSEFDEIYRSKCYLETTGAWRELIQTDLLVTAWELTTLSFVIDWVCNVGAWLTGLTPQLRGDFAGTVVSIKATNVRSAIFEVAPGTVGSGTPGSFYWEKRIEQYVRFPYNGIPYPRLNLKLNPAKLFDLIALNRRGRSDFIKALQRR